jgi:hypothetical protein
MEQKPFVIKEFLGVDTRDDGRASAGSKIFRIFVSFEPGSEHFLTDTFLKGFCLSKETR